MNSIIDKNGKYIGLCFHIKDTDFFIRNFTKFYNLSTHNNLYSIDLNTGRNLIHNRKYNIIKNQIYVNDPVNDKGILKSINVGDYMVFINITNKLYLFNKKEFNNFMCDNNYTKEDAITYLFGIDDGINFKHMHLITSNSYENAKKIYFNRYQTEPVCIGIIEDSKLNIISDKKIYIVPIDR